MDARTASGPRTLLGARQSWPTSDLLLLEVDAVRVGDRRAILRGEPRGNRPGTFAQFVALPVEDLVEIPTGRSEPEAAEKAAS